MFFILSMILQRRVGISWHRNPIPYREVEERMQDWGEVLAKLPNAEHADLLSTQAARCMDCGTPFCHQTATGD